MKKYDFSSILAEISLIDEMSVEGTPFSTTRLENHTLKAKLRERDATIKAKDRRISQLMFKVDCLEEQLQTRPVSIGPVYHPRGDYLNKGQKGQH